MAMAAPGTIVTDAVAPLDMPLASAVTVATPATVPDVTEVDAMPAASVVADVGVSVSAPVVLNVTSTPGTATPFRSVTLTAKLPADAPTLTLDVGDVVAVRRAGEPALT